MFCRIVNEHCHAAEDLEWPQINIKSGNSLSGTDASVQFAAAVDDLKRASGVAAKGGDNIVIGPIDLIENPAIFLTTASDVSIE